MHYFKDLLGRCLVTIIIFSQLLTLTAAMCGEWQVLQNDTFCDGSSSVRKVIHYDSDIASCQVQVLADPDCSNVFFGNGLYCECVRINEECDFQTSSLGNNVYEYAACPASTHASNASNETSLSPTPTQPNACRNVFADLDTLTPPWTGSTSGLTNSYKLSCGGSGGGRNHHGNERVFRVSVPAGGTLSIQQLQNSYDSRHQLSHGSSCPGRTIACRDGPYSSALLDPETWTNTGNSTEYAWYIIDVLGSFTLDWSVNGVSGSGSGGSVDSSLTTTTRNSYDVYTTTAPKKESGNLVVLILIVCAFAIALTIAVCVCNSSYKGNSPALDTEHPQSGAHHLVVDDFDHREAGGISHVKNSEYSIREATAPPPPPEYAVAVGMV